MMKKYKRIWEDFERICHDERPKFEQAKANFVKAPKKSLKLLLEIQATLQKAFEDDVYCLDDLGDEVRSMIALVEEYIHLKKIDDKRIELAFECGYQMRQLDGVFAGEVQAQAHWRESMMILRAAQAGKRDKAAKRKQDVHTELRRRLAANKRLTKTAAINAMAGEKKWGSRRQLIDDCKGSEWISGETAKDETSEPDEAPVDYGVCPHCKGSKWKEDDNGVSCAKCKHPHSEALGDIDGDQLKTLRSRTIKTGAKR